MKDKKMNKIALAVIAVQVEQAKAKGVTIIEIAKKSSSVYHMKKPVEISRKDIKNFFLGKPCIQEEGLIAQMIILEQIMKRGVGKKTKKIFCSEPLKDFSSKELEKFYDTLLLNYKEYVETRTSSDDDDDFEYKLNAGKFFNPSSPLGKFELLDD